jgi:VCBS repeat-containing protein
MIGSVEGSAANVGVAVAGDHGTLTLFADGDYEYVADLADDLPANGSGFDTFLYQIADEHGGTLNVEMTFRVIGDSILG